MSKSKFDEVQIQVLLDALAKTDDISDVNELRRQLQAAHNQIAILQQKHRTFISEIAAQRKKVAELNKERVQTKKHVFELTFQRDVNEHHLKSAQNESKVLRSEIKLKNALLVKLENERRKANYQLQKSNKTSISRSTSSINLVGSDVGDKNKNMKQEMILENGKKLLNNGLATAYLGSKSAEDLDKTLVLQRLLLSKAKEIAEKNLRLEETEKKCNELMKQMTRLKQAKHLAEELTNTRHKLNVKTRQIQGLKLELNGYKTKLIQLAVENKNLKQKIIENQKEKTNN